MPVSSQARQQLCERFTASALNTAWQRRPDRNYSHEVVRSDSTDAYEIRLSAWWGQTPDLRERRLRFDVDLHSLDDLEGVRAVLIEIEDQVRQLEAGCDDIERGTRIPARRTVTVAERDLQQALVDRQLAVFGEALSDRLSVPGKSLWEMLDDL